MRLRLLILLFLLFIPFSHAQKAKSYVFDYTNAPLKEVIRQVESKFDIKFSFVESALSNVSISLTRRLYDLQSIIQELEQQTTLKIMAIDNRYYSISQQSKEPQQPLELKEILVAGFLSKGINKFQHYLQITPKKLDVLPGVTDADLLLSLQQFPGVKSPNETATGLYVRGGTSDQNLILWDGIRMYHPGHLFGMISGFNPNAVDQVTFQVKGTHPKFGERIASTINIQSIDSVAKKMQVNAGVNGLNADLVLQAPLVKEKVGIQLSGRKSYTQYWQSPTFNALTEKVFQNTNFSNFNDTNRFGFEDYTAKLSYDISSKSHIALAGIWIANDLDYSSLTSDRKDRNQKMKIVNHGYSLTWNQQYTKNFRQQLLFHYSGYRFLYDKNEREDVDSFALFQKRNRITDSGIDCNFEWNATPNLQVDFGYQLKGSDISHSFTTSNQDLEIVLNQKQLFALSNVFFSNLNYSIKDVKCVIGARVQSISELDELLIEPRLLVQKQWFGKLTAQLTYERKNQIMSQFRESIANDLSLENYIWILSDNKQYPIQQGHQYTAGIIFKDRSWLLDIDAYYRTIDGITSLTFGFLNPADPVLHQGSGFTKGVDVLLQKSAPTWKAWATYTYQDAQNKFDQINNGNYFDTNAGIRHNLSVSCYKKWDAFALALGWFWRTGRPYSPLNATNEISFLNSEQLPVYHRLDLSAIYQFKQSQTWSGKIGVSFYNVYDRRTVISREYERIYTNLADVVTTKFRVQDYQSLGFMPNLFLRIAF